MIAPNRCHRAQTQDGRPLASLPAAVDGGANHRLAPKLPQTLHPLENTNSLFKTFYILLASQS